MVAGDFNAKPGSEVTNILDSSFTRTCFSNCSVTIHHKIIDFIAFKPSKCFEVLEHKVITKAMLQITSL